MSIESAGGSNAKAITKTLYTPVFYATPQPSSSGLTSRKETPDAYLEALSRQHIALAQIVEEVPSSRPGSPVEGEDSSQQRIGALRRRVLDALKNVKGDASDGKWGIVIQLLRMPGARRKRWLGATTEGIVPESSAGWINARSEREWEEWHTKWQQDILLKHKIQSWQQKVDPAAIVAISDDPEDAASVEEKKQLNQHHSATVKRAVTAQSASSRGEKQSSTLVFPVVKRSSYNIIGKPKPPAAGSSTSGIRQSDLEVPQDNVPLVDSAGSPENGPQHPSIEDVSEASFLPPSFPSQLVTSTPNPRTHQRHKPAPITLVPPSSPPLSTPASVRVYGRQRNVTQDTPSAAEPPATPTRYPNYDSQTNNREKRPRSVTPPHAIKKPRTTSPLPSSEALVPPSTPISVLRPVTTPITPAITPQRATMPKLTDLLASSKKAKASPKSRTKTSTSREDSSDNLPTAPEPKTYGPVPLSSVPPQIQDDDIAVAHELRAQVMGMPEPSDIYDKLNVSLGFSADYDIGSPTKSLSSLAASDSEDEDDQGMDLGLGDFQPPFTSTQAEGPGQPKSGSGLGWIGYNSQFDVDGTVDMVSKFMEKDVDYEGWLRDPEEEGGHNV